MPRTDVLAKAGQLSNHVVAVTGGTSLLGTRICEQAASAGATVYALDADPEALARQAISFRQNNLRLRIVHGDLESESSMMNAVQEIVTHAPPIDLWIHAQTVSLEDLNRLHPTLTAFGNHFCQRGKGTVALHCSTDALETFRAELLTGLQNSKIVELVAFHLHNASEDSFLESATQLLALGQFTPGIHLPENDTVTRKK